jgi:hypothetical protein
MPDLANYMNNKKKNPIYELIPWYVNNTLSEADRKIVEECLHNDEKARDIANVWHQIFDNIHRQPRLTPPPNFISTVTSRLSERPKLIFHHTRLFALLLSALILIALWIGVQPGIVLQWRVQDQSLNSFRILRAETGKQNYKLISEITAQAGISQYTYVDLLMVPWQSYTYMIEGIQSEGTGVLSQVVTGNPINALPGQIAIVIISLCIGFGGIYLINYHKVFSVKLVR